MKKNFFWEVFLQNKNNNKSNNERALLSVQPVSTSQK